MSINSIAVFCGSNTGRLESYAQHTLKLIQMMAEKSVELVYGGGNVGLMGLIADEMIRQKGKVTGVITEKLVGYEKAHQNLSKLHIVATMHERKALMTDLSDAFIIVPGGIGTMDEFFECFTWNQLGIHSKPIGILNSNGYYDGLLRLLENMIREGFLKTESMGGLVWKEKPEDLLPALLQHKVTYSTKWLEKKER